MTQGAHEAKRNKNVIRNRRSWAPHPLLTILLVMQVSCVPIIIQNNTPQNTPPDDNPDQEDTERTQFLSATDRHRAPVWSGGYQASGNQTNYCWRSTPPSFETLHATKLVPCGINTPSQAQSTSNNQTHQQNQKTNRTRQTDSTQNIALCEKTPQKISPLCEAYRRTWTEEITR